MRDRRTRALLVVAGVVVLVLVAVVVVRIVGGGRRTDLEQALDTVPASTLRVSFTDWAQVRRAVGVPTRTDPDQALISRLTERSYSRDLSAASSIDEASQALQAKFGFGPATADWEIYAQSKKGAAMVLQLPDDADFDDIAADLQGVGFSKPGQDDGVWRGGEDVVAQADSTISPELQYVVLLRDQHQVVSSDTASYAAVAAKSAATHDTTVGDLDSVDQMARRVGTPAAATMWTRDFACSDLSMAEADPDAQKQGRQLVAAAGKISPLSGLTMALGVDQRLTVAEQFVSGDQAQENLDARAKLAVGPSPGRGTGSFSDDYRLTASRSEGSTVLLTLRPRSSTGFPLSGLNNGAVLLATC